MERLYTNSRDCHKTGIKFNHIIDEKQSLLESEQLKFAKEFIKKYGDECWNEQDIESLLQQNK